VQKFFGLAALSTLALCGCNAPVPNSPLLVELVNIMEANLPPYERGFAKDVTEPVCAIADTARLDELVGLKIDDHEITREIITGTGDVPDGSSAWIITRSKPFAWSQDLMVIFEPNGDCNATLYFRGLMG
jgi:hypothetical protein